MCFTIYLLTSLMFSMIKPIINHQSVRTWTGFTMCLTICFCIGHDMFHDMLQEGGHDAILLPVANLDSPF
jgi:hypothetical protein